MNTTSVSLLHRLRTIDDDRSWEQFVRLYTPFIYHWGKSKGLDRETTTDLVQEVLEILVHKLPEFEYNPQKRFRGWLRTVTVNKANDILRKKHRTPYHQGEAALQLVSTEPESDLFEEANYRAFLVQRAKQLVEAEFEPTTWQACWMFVTEGRRAQDIGEELGMSPNAVRVAKSRVLHRLREELDGLLD